MSKQGKGGRVPLTEKMAEESMEPQMDEFDISLLHVDKEIKKTITEKGFACRWINATQYRNNGNFHHAGWRPYKHEVSSEQRGSLDFQYGVSAEGYLIRGDNLLAIKPLEHQKRWADRVRRQAKINAGQGEEKVQEFREKARELGAKALVGYEENE